MPLASLKVCFALNGNPVPSGVTQLGAGGSRSCGWCSGFSSIRAAAGTSVLCCVVVFRSVCRPPGFPTSG